jgi:hypothetical protein
MSYPFSVVKKTVIKHNNKNVVLQAFQNELKKLEGAAFRMEENKLKIIECYDFSSRGSNLKNLNRGDVCVESIGDKIHIKARVYLFEHLILLSTMVIMCLLGFFSTLPYTPSFNSIGLVLILTFAIFVFAYLFPLIEFYTFFNKSIKNIPPLS